MKIFVAVVGLDASQKTRIERELKGQAVVYRDALADDAARQAAVGQAEIVFGNVPAAWLVSARQLRWLQLDSAGVDSYLKINETRVDAPVILTNLRDFYGTAVAEATLAGILAFFRQLPRLLVAQRDGRWIKREIEASIGMLHRSRIVILGAGAIGRKLAALLAPFETDVRFYARTAPEAVLHTRAELDAALASADVVINTLPQTPETVGLFDRARLAHFRPTALLVNVGRGSAVDEAALLEALDAGQLGGAILDVTKTEPLPADNPLWRHARVVLTQHTGGRFPGEAEAKVTRFLENFGRFAREEPLMGTVDLRRGY